MNINPKPEPEDRRSDEQKAADAERTRKVLGEDLPRHESYGLIQISRVQGTTDLYGTPIRSHSFISLSIHEATERFNLGTEWKHEGGIIAEVWMTELQFAEAITNMNRSPGTPVTLKYTRQGDGLKKHENPPRQESAASRTREEFRKEVEERMATMKSVKRRIDKLMEEGNLAKTRRGEISGEIERLLSLFTSSAPFFMERFEENADAVVATAKAQITAHADLVLRETGIKALQRGDVALLGKPNPEPEGPAGS